uniref:Uncharacterized protein n=1 Tax=Anguilla anguilla TaxID=7936 RepID=A0A0E9WP79_ANGAN
MKQEVINIKLVCIFHLKSLFNTVHKLKCTMYFVLSMPFSQTTKGILK